MRYEGLSTKEVQERVDAGQVNGTQKHLTRSTKEIVRANTITYFNFVNIILFIIVMLTGQLNNGLFILTTVVNTLIGIYQELKSKKLLDQMQIMVEEKIEAKRDGRWAEVLTEDIVRDDLIRLDTGDQVPADGTLVEGYLEVNESLLTGEADTVIKKEGDPLYSGTSITAGEASVRIDKVGAECVSAQIMAEAQKDSRSVSQLNKDLNKLIRVISFAIIPVGIILFLTHLLVIGQDWQSSILRTVAAVVGMIPEGLVVLTSIALAVSVIRLSQKHVLVQDLFSIESLARVDTICLDKTGTITSGEMQVSQVELLSGMEEAELHDIMSSYLAESGKPNATSKAMIDFFGTRTVYKKTSVLPFSSDRKYAAASLEGRGSYYVGAVNFLFPDGAPTVNKRIRKHTALGERVIVIAHSDEKTCMHGTLPEDLMPAAMICIRDVLRDHVQDIMRYFQEQDVDIRVISGDDAATVSSLARQAGIPYSSSYVDMSETKEDYRSLVRKYKVFGRVRPEQKKALVEALQAEGHTVAMTGDGVNDVPALKKADVSVAMAAGSSAAKDSASIVLLTNDFGQMPSIVDEGRRVINNISRASSMYLVKTVFSILLSIYVILSRSAYPFLPIHLSIISAVGVGIPTFFLQLEPSFERVQGKFFTNALRKAVPSALTVMITALACMLIRYLTKMEDLQFYGIFVALTGYIYLFTLHRVYYPPTRLRRAIIIIMGILFIVLLGGFPDAFSVSYRWTSLLVIIPGCIGLPYLLYFLADVYDRITAAFHRLKEEDV